MIGALFALGGALCWGAGQVITKVGAAHTSTTRFGWIRSVVGLAWIAALALFTSEFTLPKTSLLLWAVAAGVLDCFIGALLFCPRASAHSNP